MSRVMTVAAAGVAALAVPAQAYAAESGDVLNAPPISLIVSLIGMVVAIILLVEALAVRRVGAGGAIADKISYVILATVCLAASAVAQWTRNFVVGVTLDQVQFASQVFVITAMGLLAAYFASVRRALQGFLKSMKAPQPTAEQIDSEGESRG